MPTRDIVAIGASAGGVEALRRLVRGLREDVPAALFVVLHVPAAAQSSLPQILSRAGPLAAAHAIDGEPIERGRIYVASPDHHLLVGVDHVRVTRGPRQNGHRPAVDPLFRSAAEAYGPRVVGIVLSGALDDGAAGLAAIKRAGGVAIVQSPDEALVTSMPRSALDNVEVDHCLSVASMGEVLFALAVDDVDQPVPFGGELQVSGQGSQTRVGDVIGPARRPVGEASGFNCPECGGSLWEVREGGPAQYRCHVGHGYSADTLLSEQSTALEGALWTAYRALQERTALARRLAAQAQERGHSLTANRFQEQADDAQRRSMAIWDVIGNDASDPQVAHEEQVRAG